MYPLHPGHPGSHEALIVLLALGAVATGLVLIRMYVLGRGGTSSPSEG